MQVFSKEWFLGHQKKLLWLANTWLGKRLLRIHKDCPKGKRIIKLLPNCYTWDNEDGTVSTDFRTHNKFAKRLYYGLKPIWYAMHWWDWLVADRIWYPELSFSFDTLTAYPAAGAVSPCDGDVSKADTSSVFSDIRAFNGSVSDTTSTTVICGRLASGATSPQYIRLSRGIYMFDTSPIPDTSLVQTAIFSLFGETKTNTVGLSDSHAGLGIVSTNPASTDTLIASDYNIANWGSIRYATDIGYAAFLIEAYNNFTFNQTGKDAVNKVGITKIGTRYAVDIDNGSPAWALSADSFLRAYSADFTGTSKDPKLVVSYYLPSMMMFFE